MDNTKSSFREKFILIQKKIPSLINGIIYLNIFLLPLIFLQNTYTIFTLPKLVFFEFSLALILFLKIFNPPTNKNKQPTANKNLNLILFLLFFSLCLMTVFSKQYTSSFFGQFGRYLGLITYAEIILFSFISINFINKENLKTIFKISIASSTIVSLITIYQNFAEPLLRPASTIGHGSHLGIYLAINIVILLSFFFKKSKSSLALLFPLLLTHLAALYFSGSKSAFVGLALVGICYLFSLIKNKYKYLILILPITLLFIFKPWKIIENKPIPDRLSWAYSSIEMFSDYPLFGTGLSTFRDMYNSYRRTDYFIPGPGEIHNLIVPEAAHSEFFNSIATGGIVGLFFYLLINLYPILLFKKNISEIKSSEEKQIYKTLFYILLTFTFSLIFNFYTFPLLFFHLFFYFNFISINSLKSKTIIFKNHSTYKIIKEVAFLGTIAGIFLIPLNSISNLISNYNYNQFLNTNSYDEKLILTNNILSATPFEYYYPQSIADNLFSNLNSSNDKISNLKKIISLYEKAISINNKFPSTYHNLALAYYKLHKELPTEDLYKQNAIKNFMQTAFLAKNNSLYLKSSSKYLADLGEKLKAKYVIYQNVVAYPDDQDALNFYKKL